MLLPRDSQYHPPGPQQKRCDKTKAQTSCRRKLVEVPKPDVENTASRPDADLLQLCLHRSLYSYWCRIPMPESPGAIRHEFQPSVLRAAEGSNAGGSPQRDSRGETRCEVGCSFVRKLA